MKKTCMGYHFIFFVLFLYHRCCPLNPANTFFLNLMYIQNGIENVHKKEGVLTLKVNLIYLYFTTHQQPFVKLDIALLETCKAVCETRYT